MRPGLIVVILTLMAVSVWAQQTEQPFLEIKDKACEQIIKGESRSSARSRATDKASFNGIKKIAQLASAKEILDEHEINVMVYRLVDEYLEDLKVETIEENEKKICVRISGWLNPQHVSEIEKEFIQNDLPVSEPNSEEIVQAASKAMEEIVFKPEDPESLALVYIGNLKYFNGTETSKFSPGLMKRFKDNTYFYLTDEADLADYKIYPKVHKAKVENMGSGHKRLQMAVGLEIEEADAQPVSEIKNRYILFDTDKSEQEIAARLIGKLLDEAADGALRRIEHQEQLKIEKKALGKSISK